MAEPGAVNLFAPGGGKPRCLSGLLDAASLTLAVVETEGHAGRAPPRRVLSFGGVQACLRLMALLERVQPLDLSELSIEAVPAPHRVDDSALAVLGRRDFVFVIRATTG